MRLEFWAVRSLASCAGEAVDGTGHADHRGEFIFIEQGGGFDEVAAGDECLAEEKFNALRVDEQIAPEGAAAFGEEGDVVFVEEFEGFVLREPAEQGGEDGDQEDSEGRK